MTCSICKGKGVVELQLFTSTVEEPCKCQSKSAQEVEKALPLIVNSFIEAALFSVVDNNGKQLIQKYGVNDLDQKSIQIIQNYCRDFAKSHYELICQFDQQKSGCIVWDMFGIDFWMTTDGSSSDPACKFNSGFFAGFARECWKASRELIDACYKLNKRLKPFVDQNNKIHFMETNLVPQMPPKMPPPLQP